jgi:hypothetical protein
MSAGAAVAPPVAVAGVRLHRVRRAIRKMEDFKSSPNAVNPFSHESAWTKREYAKAVVGIVLVPLRFVLVCLLLSMMVLVSMVSSSSLRTPYDPTKPMSEERRWWQAPLLPITRAVLFVCGVYRLKVTGELCDPEEARLLVVAPHTTALDAFVQFIAGNAPSVVSKAEVANLPFFGTYHTCVLCVPACVLCLPVCVCLPACVCLPVCMPAEALMNERMNERSNGLLNVVYLAPLPFESEVTLT